MKISNTVGLINSSIAAHAALTSGVHGAGSNHLALFHSASQLLSKVIWKDAPFTVLNDINRTTTLAWTDADLTAQTSAIAKFAILQSKIKVDSIVGGATATLELRKNGTTPSAYFSQRVGSAAGDGPSAWIRGFFIVGLDVGQVMEYQISIGGTIQVDTNLYLMGYIE